MAPGIRRRPRRKRQSKGTTMMYGYGNGIGGWGYALAAIGMILFWGAVIYGIMALVRHTRRDDPQGREPAAPPVPEPERLLAERFARGEIDEGEYHQRLTSLRAAGPPAAR
jgi:putative membrane protein